MPAFVPRFVAALLASAFAVGIGLPFATISGFVSPVWPASGVAVALAWSWGRPGLAGAVVGASLANLTRHPPLAQELVVAVGHACEAATGAALLQRFGYRPSLDRTEDVGALLAAGLLGALCSAAFGAVGLSIGTGFGWAEPQRAFATWWSGNFVGILVATPAVLAWVTPVEDLDPRPIERAVHAAVSTAVCATVFLTDLPGATAPLAVVVMPFLVWAALRLGPRTTTATILVAMALAVSAVVRGTGPFRGVAFAPGFWVFTAFGVALGVATLLVLAGTEARRRAFVALRAALEARRQLEQQLVDARKMEALGTFARGVAHDFNNLLAAVQVNADVALEDPANREGVRRALDDIRTVARQGAEVVNQIVAFGRPDEANRRPVLVSDAVEAVARSTRPGLASGVTLVTNVRPPGEPAVDADPVQLERVLHNLVRNAVLALPDARGTITLSVEVRSGRREEPPDVVLQVADTGVGMSAEVQRQMFEPFFTTRTGTRGSGLGLAVVHGIVQSHRGAIEVSSLEDAGTTVRILLPGTRRAPGPFSAPPPAASVGDTGSGRVLLVDDDPLVLDALRRQLGRWGYAVTATTEPAQALGLLRARPVAFDVVVTDLSMPGLTGGREIAAAARPLPVILVTGHADPAEVGEDAFTLVLRKPFPAAALARALRGVLARRTG